MGDGCVYTVDGKQYSEKELKARLFDGALEDYAKEGVLPKELRYVSKGGGEAAGGAGEPPEEPQTGEDEPNVTSIKNKIVDKEREKRGLPSAIEPARKEFGTTWDEAMQEVEDNPAKGEELVTELKKKPRPLTDVENAILLHRQILLQTAYDKVNDAINKAKDSGDEAGVIENRLKLAGLSDALQDIYNVGKSVGTENARGLGTRRMLAKENFTLAAMETQKRAANNGRELTDQERAHLEELSNRIKDLEAKVQKLQDEAAVPKQPKVKTKKTDEDFKKEREKILGEIGLKLKKGGQNPQFGGLADLYAIAPDIAKYVKSLVEQGITKLDEIVTHIYDNLKDSIKGLTKDDIKDAVTGKYDQPQQKRSLSPEEEKAKAELERNKMNFRTELEKDRMKNRSSLEKGLDTFVKWERAFKLSSPLTLAKLTMAAIYRTVSTPIEEGIGAGITAILPRKLTDEAYREAGFNAKAEAKAITNQFTKGMRDAAQTLSLKKGGRSDLEVMYGKEGLLPPEAADFLGHLHGALKAPIKRAEFERSFEKRTAAMINNGIDVSDPLVQTSIAASSYKDANRAIFMQDNSVTKAYQTIINYLERPKGSDGEKAVAAFAKFMLPFVKVPTNIVGETINYTAGLPIGLVKLSGAMLKGLDEISPDEKDKILRLLKKGTIGGAMLLLGYANPNAVGGYYTGKRREDDVTVGGLRLFGINIPKWLVHNPLMETLQIGATIRRVQDTYIGKTGKTKGFGEGLWESAMGLTEEVPFINTANQLKKIGGTEADRSNFLGEMLKNTAVPALVQNIAQWTDAGGQRRPQSIIEHLKMGVPGLRQQISPKRGYTNKDLNDPSFSYFTDKGLSLPYSSERSIKIRDAETGKQKSLSDFSQAKISEYYDTRKEFMKTELDKVRERGYVYVDKSGELVSINPEKGRYQVNIDDLTKPQLADLLNDASRRASEKTKQEVFYKKD